MALDEISLGMEKRGQSIAFTVAAEATLAWPTADAPTEPGQPLTFRLAATVDVGTNSINGSLTLLKWEDAFGVPDLTVKNLTVSVSVSGAAVVLGLGGMVTLPAEWAAKIGMVPGTPVTLVAAIDVRKGAGSCIGLEIGETGSTKTVLDIGNTHAVTAKHATFYIAPMGCFVGPYLIGRASRSTSTGP